jgi:hypothetical protein
VGHGNQPFLSLESYRRQRWAQDVRASHSEDDVQLLHPFEDSRIAPIVRRFGTDPGEPKSRRVLADAYATVAMPVVRVAVVGTGSVSFPFSTKLKQNLTRACFRLAGLTTAHLLASLPAQQLRDELDRPVSLDVHLFEKVLCLQRWKLVKLWIGLTRKRDREIASVSTQLPSLSRATMDPHMSIHPCALSRVVGDVQLTAWCLTAEVPAGHYERTFKLYKYLGIELHRHDFNYSFSHITSSKQQRCYFIYSGANALSLTPIGVPSHFQSMAAFINYAFYLLVSGFSYLQLVFFAFFYLYLLPGRSSRMSLDDWCTSVWLNRRFVEEVVKPLFACVCTCSLPVVGEYPAVDILGRCQPSSGSPSL